MEIKNIKESAEINENFDFQNLPKETALEQNDPNPFYPVTSIRYSIAKSGQATLKIYDLKGKEISTLADSYHPAGKYHTKFNGNHLSGGTYICRLQTIDAILSRKMELIK
jgi:hypothetical protein